MQRTRLTAGTVVAAAAATVVAITAPTASAHVSIDPAEAEQGGYSVIDVKVPNERDNASTVRLELHLDPEHPLTSVMPQPVPGWDVEVETAELDEPVEVHGSEVTEAPSVITWTGGEIAPGQFQSFPLSVGPLPEGVDRLVFDAIQTYSNDEVVRWIEEPAEEGGTEPDNPSPVLTLTPAADASAGDEAVTDDAANGEAAGESGADTQSAADGTDDDASDTMARVLGAAGIVVGLAGVAFGVLAGRRRNAS
ncbi:YcnI family protein [Streptomyces sp. RFCAC02]|uniref:YcnI family copper-binding membrane protein n=1 Tax=Streptomyces sp. RFCAC02 TaxID=2499143 RepID=UPI0010210905|nr:YcnI family protein [Streptomyces sp. RFCAC02]